MIIMPPQIHRLNNSILEEGEIFFPGGQYFINMSRHEHFVGRMRTTHSEDDTLRGQCRRKTTVKRRNNLPKQEEENKRTFKTLTRETTHDVRVRLCGRYPPRGIPKMESTHSPKEGGKDPSISHLSKKKKKKEEEDERESKKRQGGLLESECGL